MLIKGLQKTTLLDYPGKVACTVFTGGCNFRCPFCHNASLVLHVDTEDSIEEQELLAFLKKRSGILDGVCITGGEPLLQPDIERICERIHELGLLVKLDTNGSFPKRLAQLIDKGLIDYVAMDVKNSKEEYARTCGLSKFPQEVDTSIHLLMSAPIPYEFRTTVLREFHSPESMKALAQWIQGADKYFIQGFQDSGDLIGHDLSAFTPEEMQKLLQIVKPYVPCAELRGI